MSATLVLTLPRARSRGAHRKPFPLAAAVIWGSTTVVSAGIITIGVLAMLAPRVPCHAVPMHLGWPHSRCHLAWKKWRQP